MKDKRSAAFLKKYYLPYDSGMNPDKREYEAAVADGAAVPLCVISHDEMISEIKMLAERISVQAAAKAFLYSLSSGDTRYRTVLSSLLWARALPQHKAVPDTYGCCKICGCTHGIGAPEETDLNRYGVFRFLPPVQYGNIPDIGCAEYVYNDLKEFEKLPPAEPCDNDNAVLNGIFAAVELMKPHNKASALITEIKKHGIIDTTANGIHFLLGVLSMCGILETQTNKGYLHSFTECSERGFEQDNDLYYPLKYWKGKDGINYDSVKELFPDFDSGKHSADSSAALTDKTAEKPPSIE